MDRRHFLLTSVVGALAAPLAAGAQPRKLYRIGYLDPVAMSFSMPSSFVTALREQGWVEQRDYVLEARWAGHKSERLTEFAAELVRLRVNLMVARGTEAATAASRATSDIPIVFTDVADPIGAKLVTSLARPGGNVTGVASVAGEAAAKQLELLNQTLPGGASPADVLWVGTAQPDAPVWRELQAIGHRLGITLRSKAVIADQAGLERALESLSQNRPKAVLVYADDFAVGYLTTLGRFAGRQRLPMASNAALLTWEGGLMSYSRSQAEEWNRTAEYVVQIRNGVRPADLPVRRAETFQLLLNSRTAKALGLTIPSWLLLRADQVIE